MSGFTMPKKGEGAAMLRDLREEERPAREDKQPPVLTEARKHGSADARTDASEEASTSARQEGRAEGSTEARPQARKAVRKAGSKAASAYGSKDDGAGAPDFLDAVDLALASREPLVGGVKATVDMSPDLSTRAKRYLADHRGQNTRQVLIALFDAFLTAKGY